jgi:hypothetical protein
MTRAPSAGQLAAAAACVAWLPLAYVAAVEQDAWEVLVAPPFFVACVAVTALPVPKGARAGWARWALLLGTAVMMATFGAAGGLAMASGAAGIVLAAVGATPALVVLAAMPALWRPRDGDGPTRSAE